MKQFFVYWVWPNPAGWQYQDPKVISLIAFGFALVVLSFIIRVWRRKLSNPQTRKLSASWPSASFWFGIVALFLVVCRVELIQFLSMRLLWLFWLLGAVFFCILQVAQFRRRHYTVMARTNVLDERERYLPRKK